MIILFYSLLPVNLSLQRDLIGFILTIFTHLSNLKNRLKVDRNIDSCQLQLMFFAAKIQKDTFLQVSELQPQQKKDLCLTNFSLDEFESMAAIYLNTKQANNVLIVCLEKPHLSAYHTSITLSHRELAHCKIQSRSGDVFVIGKWIDIQQNSSLKAEDRKGDEITNQKQEYKEEKRQKRIVNSKKIDEKSSQKKQQQQTLARALPVRQSSRVRTPSTSQATPAPTNKKSSSSSKGKSLLDMMNNLDEEDDEESSYSEQDDSEDSSEESSSQQQDEKSKKNTIAEKIRRKSIPVTLNRGSKIEKQSKRNRKESRNSDSSEESQEKPKEKDEIQNKKEPTDPSSTKNDAKQQKPFNYLIPTRLPDFLSKK